MSERTPQDFAIEHAEYMAQSAEDLIAAVNDLALAEEQHDDGTANPSDVDAARETLTEMVRDTRSCIYEFRKRRDRAAVQAAQPEAVGKPLAEMVNRFLRWKLPADFSPDCGISFKPESDYDHPEFGRTKYEPTGTNLLNYEQAQEMLCYVLAAAPTEAKPDESLFNLLFAVEQAANNGALHWEVEEAFRAYEVSKAAVMHKPSGFTFDQVIACANPDDLMPLTAQIHPTTEPDCSGGIACTTCPDKRKCQRGCVRQVEALENPDRKDLRAECDAVDVLLRGLGLDPERCRTEGGALNVGRTLSLLKDGCTEAKPATQQASGEREAFEDTYQKRFNPQDDWKARNEGGDYEHDELRFAWEGWQIARPINPTPAQDAVDAIDWAKDAREWGNALNSAGWEFDSAYRRHIGENAPAKLFNFCKPIIRDVILKYAERVAAISAKKVGEV